MPCSNSSCTIELKRLPDGSRPTRLPQPVAHLAERERQREHLGDALDRERHVGVAAGRDLSVGGDHHQAERLWIDAREFRNIGRDFAPVRPMRHLVGDLVYDLNKVRHNFTPRVCLTATYYSSRMPRQRHGSSSFAFYFAFTLPEKTARCDNPFITIVALCFLLRGPLAHAVRSGPHVGSERKDAGFFRTRAYQDASHKGRPPAQVRGASDGRTQNRASPQSAESRDDRLRAYVR